MRVLHPKFLEGVRCVSIADCAVRLLSATPLRLPLQGRCKVSNSKQIRFIRIQAVLDKIGISKASLYSRLQEGSPSFDPTFPKPVKLSPARNGTVAWAEEEVDNWMLSLLNNR